ncbi:MAG: polysaccharide biosynthesis/export family protein [Candidatus Omnitrophica bacterium]|nr:polysaccharide biosynthesis/export family protein [Candidatus Omnitrophota bacterium]MCM8791325.1 polysaccharide biosynthesis/export family protein [Candidatus Omnitrophota bacterium]
MYTDFGKSRLIRPAEVAFVCAAVFIVTAEICLFAAVEETALASGPVIVAPSGLTERERHEADREYAYQFRGKDRLLSPYITGRASTFAAASYEAAPLTEDEKLYRYFGAATKFYEQGRYEEAIEILKYILEKDPQNKYVKNYLSKVENANRFQEAQWKAKSLQEASFRKKQRIKRALADGITAYEQKRYESAVVSFRDVLELDPGNLQAKHYMNKLKGLYSREVRIDNMVRELESETEGADANFTAKDIMNKSEKTSDSLLDEAELSLTVDEIIARLKEEEAKSVSLTLSAGDVVQLIVYEHPELSGNLSVGGDGNVILPLVELPVAVKGLTIEEATEKLRAEVNKFVKDPYVAVRLVSTSKLFYFVDEVGCTPYPITRPNFTLRDALFLSDWGNNRALGRVIVIKPDEIAPIVKKVDAFDLIYRGNLANNIKIEDGDVIYVPMTIVGKTTQTVNDTIAPFIAIKSARDQWLDLKWDQKGLKSMFRIYPDQQVMPQSVNEGD